jgi:hypothetical protein
MNIDKELRAIELNKPPEAESYRATASVRPCGCHVPKS